MVGAGILCEYKPKNTKFYAREGFVAVALCWLVLAVTGALPFVLSREIPFAVDAIFEAASGFTIHRRYHSRRCGGAFACLYAMALPDALGRRHGHSSVQC